MFCSDKVTINLNLLSLYDKMYFYLNSHSLKNKIFYMREFSDQNYGRFNDEWADFFIELANTQ